MHPKLLLFSLWFSLIVLQTAHAQPNSMTTYIQVNGARLYYEKYGKGKPLLLLHGWTQSSAFWKPYLEAYTTNFEVYLIDLRGHGRSAPLTNDFSIQQAAEDIIQFIQQLKLTHVQAMGLSYGGLVLLELENKHHGLVEHMVLIGTTNRYNGKERAKDTPAFSYESLDAAFKSSLQSEHVHGEKQIKALFNPELDYQIHITADQLKQFQTKVLLINGDSDEFAGITGAIQMHTHIVHCSLWIIPQRGHLAIDPTNKDEFIKLTKAFLSS